MKKLYTFALLLLLSFSVKAQQCAWTFTSNPMIPNDINFSGICVPSAFPHWDFGDGTTDTTANPRHYFAQPGTYNVCFSNYLNGAVLCTQCQTILVGSVNSCQANFTSVTVGLNAYFIDLSNPWPLLGSGQPAQVTYTWSFGDGTSSHVRYPNHQYAQPGTYTVCFTATGAGCVSTVCDTVTVDTTIVSPVGCNAYFIFTQTSAFNMAAVNLSSGSNLAFSWDFGDGTPAVSGAYPTHQYTAVGDYNVCLTASSMLCSDTYCDSLHVDAAGNISYRGQVVGFTLSVVSPTQLTTGIGENNGIEISNMYPVPAKDELHFNMPENTSGQSSFEIFTVDGRVAMQGSLTGVNQHLNVSGLSQGVYHLQVRLNDGTALSKSFVKQ